VNIKTIFIDKEFGKQKLCTVKQGTR